MSDVSKFYINASSLQKQSNEIEDELEYQLYNLGDSSRNGDKVRACELLLKIISERGYLVSFDSFSFYVVDWFELTSEAKNFSKWLDHFDIDYRTAI